MQYQQTFQGLGDMYNLPVAMMPQAMGLLDQQQNADSMTAQDQARELSFNNANDPLKLQRASLDNQTLEGALGGVQARSRMDVRKDSNEAATNDSAIKDMLGKYKSADLLRHVTDAEGIGQRMTQLGADAYFNPVGAKERAKKALDPAHWNPDWEDMAPEDFAKSLNNHGNAVLDASAKTRNAVMLQQMKDEMQAGHDRAKVESTQIAADQRAATASQLFATKRAIAMIPKGVEDYGSKMSMLAAAEPEGPTKEKYLDESSKAFRRAAVLKAMAADTSTAQKLDYSKILGEDMSWGHGIAVPDPAAPQGTATPAITGSKGTSQFVEGKLYKDGNGNVAKYVNGKWVPQ